MEAPIAPATSTVECLGSRRAHSGALGSTSTASQEPYSATATTSAISCRRFASLVHTTSSVRFRLCHPADYANVIVTRENVERLPGYLTDQQLTSKSHHLHSTASCLYIDKKLPSVLEHSRLDAHVYKYIVVVLHNRTAHRIRVAQHTCTSDCYSSIHSSSHFRLVIHAIVV